MFSACRYELAHAQSGAPEYLINEAMRILHVVRGLTNSSGTTHIVVSLSEEQARKGADVTVISVEKDQEPAVEPDSSLVTSKCFAMSLPMRNPGISRPFARDLRHRIRDVDFAHIHAVWNFPTYYTMRTAYAHKVPYMIAPQGSFEPWALRQNPFGKFIYGKLMEERYFRRAACFQAVSAAEAEQIKDFGIEAPTFVVPNGVDTKKITPSDQPNIANQIGLRKVQKTLLYLSRLHPKKGVDILIKGFAKSARNDITLVIGGHDAGSGYESTLRQLAAESNLGGRCIFMGELKGESKIMALRSADAFALPSHSEGLPMAALEAMAAGLPLIISTGCNLPEVEHFGAGIVIEPEAEALAAAVNRLFADDEARKSMGAKARVLVEHKYSWPKLATQLLDIYQQFL